MDNVELEFSHEALETAAEQALKQKTGARGLRTILEQTLLDVMYELPSMSGISRCDVSREAIMGTASVSLATSSGEVVPFPTVEHQKSA
jgi:ATP-dependent Clp protease ATP-binding subunit ClpX